MTSQPLSRAQMRSRHRARRSRHHVRTIVLVVTIVLTCTSASGILWWRAGAHGAGSCGDNPVKLRVATSSALADPLIQAAKAYEDDLPRVDGECVEVDVRPMDLAAVEDALVSAAENKTDPGFDGWLAESVTWATQLSARPEVDTMLPAGLSVVAMSPVVAAVPEPMAEAAGWTRGSVELDSLVRMAEDPRGWGVFGRPEWGRMRVGWQSPKASAIGLDSLMTLFGSLDTGRASPDLLRAGMQRVQNALSGVDIAAADARDSLADTSLDEQDALQQSLITPATEREVVAFNQTRPKVPLRAVPVGVSGAASKVGFVSMFDIAKDRHRSVVAAEGFREFLVSAAGGRHFVADGWQVPSAPSRDGARVGEGYPPPSVTAVASALQSWSALQRRGSVLLAVDVSGSMKQVDSGADLSRLALAKRALSAAVASFSGRSSIGLWEFSRRLDGSRDHRVIVPLGPSADAAGGGTRLQAVRAGIAGLTARGDTGLYDTTLAAVREMQRKWAPETDVVVLLSDGRNDDAGSISLKQLVGTLQKEHVGDRPVRVYTIAYGAQADASALQAIAKATGGASFVAQSPADIQRVLLASLTD